MTRGNPDAKHCPKCGRFLATVYIVHEGMSYIDCYECTTCVLLVGREG